MSEFRQAIAYVDALEAHLALLQDSVASATVVGAIEDNLSFILEAVNGDVDMIMEKFRARCSMVDPVTNQPRFGPKMLAKVQDMLRRYDDVKVAVEDEAPLRLQAEGKIKELSEHQLAIEQGKIAREKKEEEARKATERARAEELKLLEQKQKAREAELQHQEQLRVEALAVAANKKREGREKERAELERQRLAAEEERKRVNASISHGKEGLEKAIAMLRDSTGSEV
ncbi:hypothetical protein PHYBOEH_005595 [Phytophthora boehmeriae]|uniref:Uncharacterized protein n=1 Tax=Phytophthora boehmeriae TaxID=109152 RepID=A0A8T1WQP6_9STRA|nr:hypothetical protein PHYBOEH_005595 [Phytophthora boehmeriae]